MGGGNFGHEMLPEEGQGIHLKNTPKLYTITTNIVEV